MKHKKEVICISIIFIIQVLFQIVGSYCYGTFPEWMWSICDALILVTPFIFGLGAGLICCLPNTISEIGWLIMKGYMGAFLHGIAFLLTVVVCGCLQIRLRKKEIHWYVICFEVSLVLENFLYRLLRTVFLTSKTTQLTFLNLFQTNLSIGNIVCLFLLIFLLKRKKNIN